MGFYAAPRFSQADAQLAPGYTPPLPLGGVVTLTPDGTFAWRASAHNAADATLQPGYSAPAPLSASATLERQAAGAGYRTIYAESATGFGFGTPEARLRWAFVEPPSLSDGAMGTPSARLATVVVSVAHGAQVAHERVALQAETPSSPAVGGVVTLRRYGDALQFGAPAVAGRDATIRPIGFYSQVFYGQLQVRTSFATVAPAGFMAGSIGQPVIDDTAIKPAGIPPAAAGLPAIANLRQYLRPGGLLALSAGKPFVGGGVRYLEPGGTLAQAFGGLTVSDGSQKVAPAGISAQEMPKPAVSPRFLFAVGIRAPGFGDALAQHTPRPGGWDAAVYGVPAIGPWHRQVAPGGADALELGYPWVGDRAQRLYVAESLESGLFGDVRIANRSRFVAAPGFDALQMSEWAAAESNRRAVMARGWDAWQAGDALAANKTPSIAPAGLDALAGLSAHVGYAIRTVAPFGVDRPGFGVATLAQPPSLRPAGIAGEIGESTVWHGIRSVEAQGRETASIGQPMAGFRFRALPAQGFAGEAFGEARAEHGIRRLLALGLAPAAVGAHAIEYRTRTIAPEGLWPNFAYRHTVGGLRFLRPEGFDAVRFGARVIPEIQTLYPQGFAGRTGVATVEHWRRHVAPAGFLSLGNEPWQRMGTPALWNLRQIIVQTFDGDSGLAPPPWPKWTQIDNRNRTVRVTGQMVARVPAPGVENAAALIEPVGLDAQAFGGMAMVAYRVRHVRPDSLEAPYLSGWSVVHNDARLLEPTGIASAQHGRPAVESNRRTLERIGGFDSPAFGVPMIADRVRWLAFDSRYTIDAPAIPLPEAKLRTQYIEPAGSDMARMGWAFLDIHWTIVTPRWTLQNLYGMPALRNLTPELLATGRPMDEFGAPSVRLQWRRVETLGDTATLIGRPQIADRNRTFQASGFGSLRMGDKLEVRSLGTAPYSLQFIRLDALTEEGKPPANGLGIAPPKDQVSRPDLNQQVIQVRQEQPATLFGLLRATANTIRVEPGYQDFAVGDHRVELWVRRLLVPEAGDPPEPPAPRISPWTIWAMTEAPEQARRNYPPPREGLHPVDGALRDPGAIFGGPVVALKNRTIRVPGGDETSQVWSLSRYGSPEVSLHRRIISLKGVNAFRSGWHSIPGTQALEQFESMDELAMGACLVGFPVTDGPVRAEGADMQRFGEARAELFNRTVAANGFASERMGQPVSEDTPFMWQGLRVGPLVPNIAEGFDAQIFGAESWVSHRVREVRGDGYDAFLSEYDLLAFDKRMRVMRGAAGGPSVKPARSLAAGGFEGFASGTPNARLAVQYIRPDGNADQFRKGAF